MGVLHCQLWEWLAVAVLQAAFAHLMYPGLVGESLKEEERGYMYWTLTAPYSPHLQQFVILASLSIHFMCCAAVDERLEVSKLRQESERGWIGMLTKMTNSFALGEKV